MVETWASEETTDVIAVSEHCTLKLISDNITITTKTNDTFSQGTFPRLTALSES